MRNKKGASIIMMLIEITVVVLVVFLVMQKTVSLADSDTILKKIAAEDMAMMVNALVGTPGDAVVGYPHDVSQFSFILGQTSIIVMKKGETRILREIRKFRLPESYTAEGFAEEKASVCLEKRRNEESGDHKIILRECREDE